MKFNTKAVFAALVMAMAASANAAVDISTEVAAAKTDIQTNGALIIGVIVAIAVIAWIRRIIK